MDDERDDWLIPPVLADLITALVWGLVCGAILRGMLP